MAYQGTGGGDVIDIEREYEATAETEYEALGGDDLAVQRDAVEQR